LAMDTLFRHTEFELTKVELAHALAFVAFAITAVVFALAMIDMVRDADAWRYLHRHHGRAAYDFFSDVAMGVVLIFMSLHLDDAKTLIASNFVFRVLDVFAESLVV